MERREVFWRGMGTALLFSPVNMLHKDGLDLLRRSGFKEVERDCTTVPIFSFSSRKGGGDFPEDGDTTHLPLIRQLPQSRTVELDDKRQLWVHLSGAGFGACMPQTHVDLHLLPPSWWDQMEAAEQPDGVNQSDGEPAQGGSAAAGQGQRVTQPWWFLKHRMGAKGQGVHPHRGIRSVRDWLQAHGPAGGAAQQQWVLQAEAAPPMLIEGRKFALRAHVLVTEGAAYMHDLPVALEHVRRALVPTWTANTWTANM